MRLPSLQALSHGRLILALRETFLTLFPLFLLLHGVSAAHDLSLWAQWPGFEAVTGTLKLLRQFLQYFWPLALGVVLAVHLARAFEVDPIIASVLVLAFLLAPALQAVNGFRSVKSYQNWLALAAVVVPVLGVACLRLSLVWLPTFKIQSLAMISPALARATQYTVPFAISFASLLALMTSVPSAWQFAMGDWLQSLPFGLALVVTVTAVNLMWWTGIHGAQAWEILTNGAIGLIRDESGALLADTVYGLVYFGGSGCAMGLALCLWWYLRDERDRRVLRWAFPFLAVNISEPLLYGLPVVGQRRLLVPFVLAPLVGSAMAMGALQLGWVHIEKGVSWMLPFGLNAWLMTSNPWPLAAMQVAILAATVLVYRPFVRAMVHDQSMTEISLRLAEQLGVGSVAVLNAEQRYTQSFSALQASHSEAQAAMRLVESGRLHLHYQPKLSVLTHRVVGLEALLRLSMPDGKLVSPAQFLPALIRAGYGDLFDAWVLEETNRDRAAWREKNFNCPVAINLTAATLTDDRAFEALRKQLQHLGNDVLEVELLESSLSANREQVNKHLQQLRALGVKILIDDFGTGYSNLSVLHDSAVDVIKMDQSLLAGALGQPGEQLYREMCGALIRLGHRLVAEGVETGTEEMFVKSCGVHELQGYWISHPVGAGEVPGVVAAVEARYEQTRDLTKAGVGTPTTMVVA